MQVHEVKSFSEYVEPLMEFMASPPLMEEKVVLVGHSYGDLCISVAMEKLPERVSVAVYAAAFMPSPDLRESLLQEDLTLALSLVRPIRLYGDTSTLQKEVNLSREKYGQVPRVYIISEKDNAIKVDFQRWMIENNPAPEVKVIAGSDHMVMFSQPKELCSYLLEIADKYP